MKTGKGRFLPSIIKKSENKRKVLLRSRQPLIHCRNKRQCWESRRRRDIDSRLREAAAKSAGAADFYDDEGS